MKGPPPHGFHLIDEISAAGQRGRPNEDRSGLAGRHAWVIDGATGLGENFVDSVSDAAWFAQSVSEALTRHAGEPDPDRLVARALADTAAAFAGQRRRAPEAAWEWPCAAFLLATRQDQGLALRWLGDCRAIVALAGGGVEAFGATLRSEAEEAALVGRVAQGAGDAAARYRAPEALAMLRAMRAGAVGMRPPPVLIPDVAAGAGLRRGVVKGPWERLLLMTDGLAAAELRYHLAEGPAAMIGRAAERGLATLVAEIRRFETEGDPDGVARPRWKRSDDATGLLLMP